MKASDFPEMTSWRCSSVLPIDGPGLLEEDQIRGLVPTPQQFLVQRNDGEMEQGAEQTQSYRN